jgi:formate-dependent nitrite reductase membrane component NrfD
LIGFLRGVPVSAFHRLVPFAVAGFAINAATGSLFLMTDPDQYIYNPAFHLKILWLLLAGVNVAVFYLVVFRRVTTLGPGEQAPALARASGAISLALWIGVIICGRMITFYRPAGCAPGEVLGWLADCIVR